jgi:hypothetical protein
MIWSLFEKILKRTSVKPFTKIMKDPIAAQETKLRDLLRYAAGTTYGKRHGFGDISSYEEFRERVPITQHKDLMPFIQAEIEGKSNTLYPEPIDSIMATSGSTGEPKLVPYTKTMWDNVSKFQKLHYGSAAAIRPFLSGKMLSMVSPAVYKTMGDWDVSWVSGYGMTHRASNIMRRKVVPEQWVFSVDDWREKFDHTVRQAVSTDKITAILGHVAFTLAILRRAKYEDYQSLITDTELDSKTKRRLEEAHLGDGVIDIQTLWPEIAVFFYGGVARDLYESVVHDMLGDIHIHESYVSTEGIYSSQIYGDKLGVVPNIDTAFFEFVEHQKDPVAPDAEAIPLSDVKINTPYRIIVSSQTCFWRYDQGDTVMFTDTDPLTLRCMGKSQNVISLGGEKVTQAHLGKAMAIACDEHGAKYREFITAPQVRETGSIYHVFVEFVQSPENLSTFAHTFDEALQEMNDIYKECRAAGIVSEVKMYAVPDGGFAEFMAKRIAKGNVVVGQTKPPRLTSFDFAAKQLLETAVAATS